MMTISTKAFTVTKFDYVATYCLLFVLAILAFIHTGEVNARTVSGQSWGPNCADSSCAVSEFCAIAEAGLESSSSQIRNFVCPSNNAVPEVDRTIDYPTAEPFTLYKTPVHYEFEELVAPDTWRTFTMSIFYVYGSEIIQCDCHENFLLFSGGEFCLDQEQGRYLDTVNGVTLIYDYLANNHGERCPAIDTVDANKDDGHGCVGNPCNPATGNKYQSEPDIINGLDFVRSYNSRNLFDRGIGKGWRHSFQKRLAVSSNNFIKVVSEKGKGESWYRSASGWRGDLETKLLLVDTADGFMVTRENGDVENYHSFGRLLSEVDAQGKTTSYQYDDKDRLISVSDNYGQSLTFGYDDDDHIVSVTNALGDQYIYKYDGADNLAAVIYPDLTPDDNADNPRRIYHYENTQYPSHLTGITDENGDRYATWAYDADGKAISTEHAQTTNTVGQEKFELDYQGSN